MNDIYPEVSTLKDPELQSAQLAARARFLPDYTVRAATNIEYLRITAEHYLLARRLTVWVTKLHPQGNPPTALICLPVSVCLLILSNFGYAIYVVVVPCILLIAFSILSVLILWVEKRSLVCLPDLCLFI